MRCWQGKSSKQQSISDSEAELKRFLASKFLLVILSVILIAVLSAFTRDFSQKHLVDAEVQELENEVEELKQQRDEYLSKINYYDSEDYLKQQAKKNLDLKEEGENVIVISDEELEKYLVLEAELSNLQNLQNNDIEDNTSRKENNENQSKLEKQFVVWWDYFNKN